MENDQLSNYVKEQRALGRSSDDIKSELLAVGWQESDIMRLLSSGVPTPQKNNDTYLVESGIQGPQSLDPKAVWMFFLRDIFFLFGFVIVAPFFYRGFLASGVDEIGVTLNIPKYISPLSLLIAFILLSVFSYLWANITCKLYKYEITEDGFKKEYGVIYKKYVTIPYERIQNVNISRGILDRLLGLSELTIFTAGTASIAKDRYGSEAEGKLPGLSQKNAEDLRNMLVHLSKPN